ncbi:Transposase [Mycoavidus cysteinexigens]|uniref:Transposase n=1 Tax=Mycoavidus cysteinexigens TaxID=1553431 RepID=A0A2Z6EUR6_9BURK|nr:Transposase [Mycoavidus cysteinexigens]GAM52034.1 hypothetical protein EBME_0497 [bacterium endosymbiont of Mortierella elongata FMR23-6]GLR02142.1 hypothetical protein GCM10007934_19560 [Mycoavidus cysteinexigens]
MSSALKRNNLIFSLLSLKNLSHQARLKELEEEKRRLKKMYAEERLKSEVIQEAMQKSGKAILSAQDGANGQ